MATWSDRVQDPKIVTADGTVFFFECDIVQRKREERAQVFTFPQLSADYVPKISSGGDGFSFNLWFSGPNHDIIAKDFREKTKDIRPLKFYHPFQKKPYTCTLLTLKEVVNIKDGNNETAFNLELHTTITGRRPRNKRSAIEDLTEQKNAMNEFLADFYDSVTNKKILSQTGGGDQQQFTPVTANEDLGSLPETKVELENTADYIYNEIRQQFINAPKLLAENDSFYFSLKSYIPDLENNPLTTAMIMQKYCQFIATTELEPDIVTQKQKVLFYRKFEENTLQLIDDISNYEIIYSAIVVGLSEVLINSTPNDFSVRREIVEIVREIDTYCIRYNNRISDVVERDNLETYQPSIDALNRVNGIYSLCADVADTLIFQARQERNYVNNKHLDLYTLVYFLYGAVGYDELDDKRSEFIEINNLKGTKIFNAQPGEEFIYYL